MMGVNIASLYSYKINIAGNPLTFIAYDCTEKIINTHCVFDVLNAMYEIPQKNVNDLKIIIEKLKRINLVHTKSITIFSKYRFDTRAWIKLERIDCNLANKINLIDMYIHYHPGDDLIAMYGEKLHNSDSSLDLDIGPDDQSDNIDTDYGTFCRAKKIKKKELIISLNHLICACSLIISIVCTCILFSIIM